MNDTPTTPEELSSILKREYEAAEDHHGQLMDLQHQAFRYYEADEGLIPFIEGMSRAMLPDVQEVVDYMHRSVLRTFVSGDRTVEFEASDEESDKLADEATAAVDYIFMRKQDGYRILSDGLFDGLLRKIGIFKTVVETCEKVSRKRITLDPVQLGELQMAAASGEVEVEDGQDNEDGTVTVTIKTTRIEKRFVDYCIPPYEYRFSPNARNEDDAGYQSHSTLKTRSELVAMGFDRDQVYALKKHSGELSRGSHHRSEGKLDQDRFHSEASSEALQEVLLHEEYARIDVDGDGIAELVKVFRVEDEILIDAETGEPSVETVDEHPFSVWSPFIRPHHLVGYSIADKVMDIQYHRSYVARQLNDGMALSNMPRPVVDTAVLGDDAADTYADILNPIPGSPIRARGGRNTVQPFHSGFDVSKSLAVMEWMTGERESRTGITRMNQGLDADTFNKTATGAALMQAAGQQHEEAVAQNFAVCIAKLFLKKYNLMRAEGERFTIKVDGKHKEVDPANWPEEVDMKILVGLGTNSKEKRVQARFAFAEIQRELAAEGLADEGHVFNAVDGIVRDLGIGQGSDFMTDPESEEGMQKAMENANKPDPEVQAAQMEIEARMAEKQADMQFRMMEAEAKLEMQAVTEEQKMTLAQFKLQNEAELARYKTAMEAQLRREQIATEAATKVNMTDQRMGGSLAA